MKSFSQGQPLTSQTPTGHSLHCVRPVGVVRGAVFRKLACLRRQPQREWAKLLRGDNQLTLSAAAKSRPRKTNECALVGFYFLWCDYLLATISLSIISAQAEQNDK